jgi:hypothetical protein
MHREATVRLHLLDTSSYYGVFTIEFQAGRMVKGMTTPFSAQVAAYCDTFRKLKDDFLNEGALVTQITVFQLSPKVDKILSEVEDICKEAFLLDVISAFLTKIVASRFASFGWNVLCQESRFA